MCWPSCARFTIRTPIFTIPLQKFNTIMQTFKCQFVKVNPINLISKLKLIFAILVPNIVIPQNPSHSAVEYLLHKPRNFPYYGKTLRHFSRFWNSVQGKEHKYLTNKSDVCRHFLIFCSYIPARQVSTHVCTLKKWTEKKSLRLFSNTMIMESKNSVISTN